MGCVSPVGHVAASAEALGSYLLEPLCRAAWHDAIGPRQQAVACQEAVSRSAGATQGQLLVNCRARCQVVVTFFVFPYAVGVSTASVCEALCR